MSQEKDPAIQVGDTATQPVERPLTLGQWKDIAHRLKEGQPVSEKEREQYLASQKSVVEITERLRVGFAQMARQVAEQLKPLAGQVTAILKNVATWQATFSERFVPMISELLEVIKNLPPKVQEALISLAEKGWYVDPSMALPGLWLAQELARNGDSETMEELLKEHFESQLGEIEKSLVKALPHRERVLRSAFWAHREGRFELSVPVFLAQADGIFMDLTGYHFFMRDKKEKDKPDLATHIAGLVRGEMSAAMLSPLTRDIPIKASQVKRREIMEAQGLQSWRELNRHLVLHGESLDYMTDINSLKAISLISYFVSVLGDPLADQREMTRTGRA